MLGDATNLIKALIIVVPNDCFFTVTPKCSKATNGFRHAPGN